MGNLTKNRVVDRFDPRIVAVVLVMSVVEYELFTFTKGVIKLAQKDAWISILLGGLITGLTTFFMVKLASRFPNENFFQYNRKVWGKIIAFIIIIGFLVYWAVYVTLLFEDASFANKFYFLRRTPSIVTMILLALGAVWLALYGLAAIIRFFQIMFPFIFIPLLALFTLGLRNVDIVNFQPVLSNGFMPVLKGALYYAGALQGLEVILFLSPFLNDVRKSVKPTLAGVGLIVFISIMQVLLAIGVMGVENVEYSVFPGLDTISLLELPGFPVERFELFLTLPWIIGVFTTICIFVYLLTYGVIQIFNLQNHKLIVYVATGIVLTATYVFPNFAVEEKFRAGFHYATLFFVFLVPVLTLLVAILRSKRDGNE